MKHLVIVNAGLSEESTTARLGRAIESAIAQVDGGQLQVSWVELRLHARSIADHLVTGFPHPTLGEVLREVSTADAVVALTPTYQGSYSGLFKSFFDLIDTDALTGTPVLLGATGGTPRHSLVTEHALRPLFTYLHAWVVPTSLFVATQDWGASTTDLDGVAGGLNRRIARAVGELMALVDAAPVTDRADADELGDVVDFAELLQQSASYQR